MHLHRKLVWITFFRLVVVTVLLASTAVLSFSERDSLTTESQVYLFGLAIAVYLLSVGYLVAMRWGPASWLTAIAYMQIVGDVALGGYLVWMTGGGESIFSFVFSLGIINAAILYYRPGAVFGALLSVITFVCITLGLQWGLLSPAVSFMEPQPFPLPRLVFVLFVNGAGFLLVGILAAYIAEQERVTGRRLSAAEEGLAVLEALHERIVQSVASGILTLDKAGRVAFINRAGEDLLLRPGADLVGRPLTALAPELSRAIEDFEGGDARGRSELMVDLGGEQRQIGYSVSNLASGGEDPAGMVVVFQDLTVLRRMEERARRNERLAAVGALAAGLAHEVRNPLASMSGCVELLKAELSEDAREQRLMDIVIRETERLNKLLDDFLCFARPAPPRLTVFDLARVVREAIELLGNDPAAACRVVPKVPEGVTLRGDEAQIRRALLNLLLNAAQAMDGDGAISVSLSLEEDWIRLSVTDEGHGIDESDLERVFDPFYTTKERGTGLGLALVFRSIEAHRGHVEVESTVGVGTTFTIALPRLDVAPALETRDATISGGEP